MMIEVLSLLLDSARNAFLQVGVFVGGMLLIFGLVNYRTKGGFVTTLTEKQSWQPVFGGLLGLTPGCGGALFVMPLFIRGHVTFGTVIAALITTAGDSAFVLIAAAPLYAVVTYLACLVVGVFSGYVVDSLKIGKKLAYIDARHQESAAQHVQVEAQINRMPVENNEVGASRELRHLGHEEGDAIDMALHHSIKRNFHPVAHSITYHGHYVYWSFIAVGLVLGVMLLFQVDIDVLFPYAGWVFGLGGTATSVVFAIAGSDILSEDSHEEEEHKLFSLKETLAHNAGDTAFATTWVFLAYFAYEFGVYLLGGADHARGTQVMESVMQTAGLAAVLGGALLGLIPGCGPQIIFVALFAKGLLPFSALFANAISQDGDALFPLIAMNRRSAFWATVITTIPAIVFGVLLYFSGIDAWISGWLPLGK